MELAKATETELLLIVAPYQGIMPSDKMIFNEAEALAKEYGVPYIDFNEYYAEIGLDPMRDCAESSHLNYDGSEKFSEYLGSYLKTRYSLPDRRGERADMSHGRKTPNIMSGLPITLSCAIRRTWRSI